MGVLVVHEGKDTMLDSRRDHKTSSSDKSSASELQNLLKQCTQERTVNSCVENGKGLTDRTGTPLEGRQVIITESAAPGAIVMATNGSSDRINQNIADRFTCNVVDPQDDEQQGRAEFLLSGGIDAVLNKADDEKPSKDEMAAYQKMFRMLHWCVGFFWQMEARGAIATDWSVTRQTIQLLISEMKPWGGYATREESSVRTSKGTHRHHDDVLLAILEGGDSIVAQLRPRAASLSKVWTARQARRALDNFPVSASCDCTSARARRHNVRFDLGARLQHRAQTHPPVRRYGLLGPNLDPACRRTTSARPGHSKLALRAAASLRIRRRSTQHWILRRRYERLLWWKWQQRC